MKTPATAVVLFSGGQDSTTCLAWALQHFEAVHALAFDYGQRHSVELAQARRIAELLKVPFALQPMPLLTQPGSNALTDHSIQVDTAESSTGAVPNTFVPGRNLLFLSHAAAYAYQVGACDLVGGMCEADYSGYPDCRRGFVDAAETAIALAMDTPFRIHTPLMQLDKAATWKLAEELGALELVVQHSHTCYNGDRQHLHAWGYGCGQCPACHLRQRGYEQAFLSGK